MWAIQQDCILEQDQRASNRRMESYYCGKYGVSRTMSLDKALDPTCRNHGSCKWCEENRRHKFRMAEVKGEETSSPF